MRHRGRKSAAEREFTADVVVPLNLVPKPAEPPRPPSDLEAPEKARWRNVNAEFLLGRTAQDTLHTALHALARARKAREVIDREHIQVLNARGKLIPHPLLAVERHAMRLYSELMAVLKLKL